MKILWIYNENLQGSQTKFYGSSIKVLQSLQWKFGGLQRKSWVSNKNLYVTNEKIGVSNENLGSYTKISGLQW